MIRSGYAGRSERRCAHRCADLFFGRNEECGLRCVYHGWKFDVEGNCVDQPSEPAESNFRHKVHIRSYPTVDMGGVIWTYMGPPEKKPPVPEFEWAQVPETHRGVSKVWQECNWLQTLEGGIDTVHTNFLHREFAGADAVMQRSRDTSWAARVEVEPTDYGYTYAGIRHIGEEESYVRAYHYVMPFHQMRPNQFNKGGLTSSGHIWVPMDDENTMVYNYFFSFGEEPLTKEQQTLHGSGNELGVDIDVEHGFRSVRNPDNDYMIDREMQRTVNYSGIVGTNTQDRAVQDSMGRIVDRTKEHLGNTDTAIVATRRMMLEAIKTVEDGGDPLGVNAKVHELRAIDKVLPRSARWLEALAAETHWGNHHNRHS